MIGGDDRKQNCACSAAQPLPTLLSAAILFMVRGRKLALAVPQDGLQDGLQDGSQDGLQEGSEELTVSRIAMNTSPGASLCGSRLQFCLVAYTRTQCRMYRILFLWHKLGNGGEERWGMCGKNWMYQKNGCGNQDNFRTFVLKIFWGHEL